ncbi:MAG: motility associated factor glycosyltransferase family protein [Sedimentisphaerales bacterium]|nr:motility associated factor glycosyltransferase family protein [Sedimentisphaerales bacterium]
MIQLPECVEPRTVCLANLKVLAEHAPGLCHTIDQVDPRDFVECEPTRSGDLTCRLAGSSGAPVYLHSRYDPVREAVRWADGVEKLARGLEEKQDGHMPMCFFVDGFGLGYHVKTLFDRLAAPAFIVVSEPNVALLRTALEHFDYAEMFASDRLIVITAAQRDEIFKKLELHSHAMMMGVVFTQPLQRIEGEFHARIHTLVSEYAAYVRTTLITVLANGVRTCTNILHNLPTYVATGSIEVLKNRFTGCPAVLVSAGPSLRKQLTRLKAVRERVVVVAVQTTLKPLLAAGIKPDFVTSLDYHAASKDFFIGLRDDDLQSVHLVAEPKAHWEVIDTYRRAGCVSLLGNEFAQLVLRGRPDDHDRLRAGCTVAHLAFYLAQYLGADPIILIGQDLGFTHHVYYSPGVELHDRWRPELSRFGTMEMKEWERIVRHRGILRQVPDYQGRPIYTDEQMFTYLQQFEKDFAQCPARVIDATEGGVLKQFCRTMPFAQAIEAFCQAPIEPERFAYLRQMNWFDDRRLPEARSLVEKRLEEVAEFLAIGRETAELVTGMMDLVDDQPALNQRMVRLDELRRKVNQRPQVYRLVSYVSQMAEMYRLRQDSRIKLDRTEGKERQRRQLRRDIHYVTELNKGCERLIDMLRDCLKRFDADSGSAGPTETA